MRLKKYKNAYFLLENTLFLIEIRIVYSSVFVTIGFPSESRRGVIPVP